MMKKIIIYCSIGLLASVILILLVATLNAKNSSQLDRGNKSIEGAYEFVSQEINLTKPNKDSYALTPPTWTGIWLIHDGYFSSVLMKDRRDKFFECECKERELGYESFAGTYTLKGDEILFNQDYSLHPFYKGRPFAMKYKIKNDTLTLTRVLHPGVEDMSEGTMKIILRKLPKRHN